MKIKLADITFDPTTYIRAGIDDTVADEYARLMEEGAVFPLVRLYCDGEHIRVCDGHHRIKAMAKNGEKEVDALILDGDRESMLLTALQENTQHGVRLTADDKRHAIRLVHREFPSRSQSSIAMVVGCTQGYVSQVLSEAEGITTNDLPSPAPSTVTGKDGKKYPSRRTRGTGQAVAKQKRPTGRGTLALLKHYWRIASEADRAAFMNWLHGEGLSGNHGLGAGEPQDNPAPATDADHSASEDPEARDDGPHRERNEQDESEG